MTFCFCRSSGGFLPANLQMPVFLIIFFDLLLCVSKRVVGDLQKFRVLSDPGNVLVRLL